MHAEGFRISLEEKNMIGDKDAAAMIAVSDLARAKSFYGGTLGLKEAQSIPEADLVMYRPATQWSRSTRPSLPAPTRLPTLAGMSATTSTASSATSRPRALA